MKKRYQLYRVWKNRELLYVGQSTSAMRRLGEHSKTADWFDGPLLVEVSEDYGSKDALDEAEYHAITSEFPLCNVVNNSRGRTDIPKKPPKKPKPQRNDFPAGMWELGQISHWVRTASKTRITRRLGNRLDLITNTKEYRAYPFDDSLTKPLYLVKPLTKDQKSIWEKPIPGRGRTLGQTIFKPNKYDNPAKWAIAAKSLFRYIRKKRGIKGSICNTTHAKKFFSDMDRVLQINQESVKPPSYRRLP